MAWAKRSLPVPDSPSKTTAALDAATSGSISSSFFMAGLGPMISTAPGAGELFLGWPPQAGAQGLKGDTHRPFLNLSGIFSYREREKGRDLIFNFNFATCPLLQHAPAPRVFFASWLRKTGILQDPPESDSPTVRGAQDCPWMIHHDQGARQPSSPGAIWGGRGAVCLLHTRSRRRRADNLQQISRDPLGDYLVGSFVDVAVIQVDLMVGGGK
jgi:hypothetical protein